MSRTSTASTADQQISRRLLTTPEAAAHLGVTVDVLKRLRAQRRIAFHRHGHRSISYKISDLDSYLARVRTAPVWEESATK